MFVHFRKVSVDDLVLWLPQPETVNQLNTDLALFLLTHVGDQFCWMIQVEKEAKAGAPAVEGGGSTTGTIFWKRAIEGFRELCDACQTTLFNIYWTCGECGFVVCIDCYKARKAVLSPSNGKENGDDEEEVLVSFLVDVIFLHLQLFLQGKDSFGWIFCFGRLEHDPDKLMPTQIIADRALECMELLLHSYRKKWNILELCVCPENPKSSKAIEATSANDGVDSKNEDNQAGPSFLYSLADKTLSEENTSAEFENLYGDGNGEMAGVANDSRSSSSDEQSGPTLRELLLQSKPNSGKNTKPTVPVTKRRRMNTVEDIVDCAIEHKLASSNTPSVADPIPSKEAIGEPKKVVNVGSVSLTRRDAFKSGSQRGMLPPRWVIHSESSKICPEVPHSWLCNGKLLRLHESSNTKNYLLFQVTCN